MSVRAYKVEKVSNKMSFNCWNNRNISEMASENDNGVVYLEKDRVEYLLKELKKEVKTIKGEEKEEIECEIETIKTILKNDFKDDDTAYYICW